jgi:hypothetical protein
MSYTPGLYTERQGNGTYILVYRVGRLWYHRKTYTAYSLGTLKEIHASRLWKQGYPTRDMAISAAKGNRAS